jgi:hypothetical protein
MSKTVAATSKSRTSWGQLEAPLNQARSLLRRLRQAVEDIEDARTIESAKSAHGKKPRIPWSRVKKEAGLDSTPFGNSDGTCPGGTSRE